MVCTICGQKFMNCDCTNLEREQHERLDEFDSIVGAVAGETLGDTLIRLGGLLQSVIVDDQGANVDDWKSWLADVGERLNNVGPCWQDFNMSIQDDYLGKNGPK